MKDGEQAEDEEFKVRGGDQYEGQRRDVDQADDYLNKVWNKQKMESLKYDAGIKMRLQDEDELE